MSQNFIDSKEILLFQEKILLWFDINARKFAWRKKDISDYEVVISEVLLQRTKAETVSKFYNNFLERFPTWESLANSNISELEEMLRPVGLFRQRAKRLKDLALKMIDYNGILPSERSDLDAIPFFGQYIANAIELQVFNRPKPLLDVNMARVLERYFGSRQLADIRYDPYLQTLSHNVVNHEFSKQISWAVLDFAAAVCKSNKPLCLTCLLSDNCKYYKNI